MFIYNVHTIIMILPRKDNSGMDRVIVVLLLMTTAGGLTLATPEHSVVWRSYF